MHVVIWTSGGQCYATASSQVVEIIPLVQAQPMPQQPAWFRGLIDYRQQLIPLLDIAKLLGQPGSPPRMCNRVLVLRTGAPTAPARPLGMLVECVLDTDDLDFDDPCGFQPARGGQADFLGPAALTRYGTIQLLDAARLPTTGDPYSLPVT